MLSFVLIAAAWCSPAQVGAPANSANAETGLAGNGRPQTGQMKVVCSGDQLTIAANGFSLSTILSEVSRCSGAKIDGSEAAARTKLFETIGPAPIQEVLASLLDATGINYVIQVSDSNPRKVATVMLLARTERGAAGDSIEDAARAGGRRTLLKPMQQESRMEEPAADQGIPSADVGGGDARPAEAPEPAAAPMERPQSSGARVSSPAGDAAPAPSQMNVQDRIAEMQRMFEQRKQMVQEQNLHPH